MRLNQMTNEQEIKEWGINFNRENRNKSKQEESIDLGIDWFTD